MPRRRRCRPLLLILAVLLAAPSALQAQTPALGQTAFANAGAEAAQEPFLRGLLLLHSFEYDDAHDAFVEARQIDPDFAMAAWGEAMTFNHPIWMQQDTDAARAALERLAPTLDGRLAKAPSEREKDYLRTAEVLFFGDAPKEERDDAFAEAMGRLHHTYPDDLDAAAFYALSLLGTAHEGRDFGTYMKAAAIAEEVFAANPQHPGAAHYLIHSYDDPVHAPLGLRPARVYATIAPAAAHALHMPSHIFVALGLWDDVVAMNEASWAAADARVQRRQLGVAQRSYHALWWLTYGYLQQGRFDDARRQLGIATEDLASSDGARTIRYHLAMMRAAYLVDTEAWDGEVARLAVDIQDQRPETMANTLFANGLLALRTGDGEGAAAALAALHALPGPEDAASALTYALDALIHLEAGDEADALRLLAAAIEHEDAMPLDFGPPSPVKPMHELYGEVLLGLDRPAEAQAQFRLALERAPRRSRSLLGLARAATAAGEEHTARWAYDALRQNWHRADASVPALSEVRQMLGEVRTEIEE